VPLFDVPIYVARQSEEIFMRRHYLSSITVGLLATSSFVGAGLTMNAGASTSAPSCASITKSLVVADGFKGATGPKITKYNYTKVSANPTNALGTTIDFGSKALVVACVSPADLKKLSVIAQGASKPTMTATQYMAYLVKTSAGAMTSTPVGGVTDYLDYGNGKEDGLGSTSKAGSVIAPATSTPSKALLAFITTTKSVL
jgi:hypothetical protein